MIGRFLRRAALPAVLLASTLVGGCYYPGYYGAYPAYGGGYYAGGYPYG